MTDERADQAKDSALTAQLHAQIMNLPTRGPKGTIHTDDYLTGHRDARHAAAELVAAALSAAPPNVYEQRLRAVLDVVNRYLPPDGIAVDLAMSEIIGLVDPWPESAAPPAPVGEPDEWTPLIKAAHPLKSHAYQQWDMAVQMVGNRRDKYALVELVCWLLQRAESASPLPQEPVGEPVAKVVVKDDYTNDEFYWKDKGVLLELSPGEYDLYLASPLPQEVKALTDEADDLPPVHIDRERMERALAGPRFTVPKGLTQEQIGAFLTAVANAYEAGAKDRGAKALTDLPVQWTSADGTSHEITLDYAARIAKWMFDTHGDVPQVDAVLVGGVQEVKAGEWLPIESALKDGRVILYCDKRGNRWTDASPGHSANGCGLPPVYWQPLPPPPSATLAEFGKEGQR